MKVLFDVRRNYGENEFHKTRCRLKMASLCCAARSLGHEVIWAGKVPPGCHLKNQNSLVHDQCDAAFVAEPVITSGDFPKADIVVAVKQSYGMSRAHQVGRRSTVVLCHKKGSFGKTPSLIVPLPVSVKVMLEFVDAGLWEAYINDDLELIRSHYDGDDSTPIGFVGLKVFREQYVEDVTTLIESAGGTVRWYEGGAPLTAGEYLKFLRSCGACVEVPGAQTQTYRFTEIVLMGRPLVTVREPARPFLPAVDSSYAVAVGGYAKDVGETMRTVERDGSRLVEAADKIYKQHWSPKAIVRRCLDD